MSDSSGSPPPLDPVRGVFLGDLAHDLSTPLTAIHGATELLLNGAYGPLEGEQRALMLEVLASARELRAFVQDVADLGALDTGRLLFASAPVDVAALVRELGSSLGETAAKRAVTFVLDTHVEGPVESDGRRLRQIFATLFADRRDATPGVPKPYSGPGLGLPLIGRVVRAWGGQVSAERRDGALVLGVDVPVR